MSAWDADTPPRPPPAHCRFEQLLRTPAVGVGVFNCPGHPPRTEVEATTHAEIVLARKGAYIREDAAGAVYIDRTVVAFFESGRPYVIEHPKPRPDLTTVVALIDPAAVSDALGITRLRERSFARSAVRATPALHLRHRELLQTLRHRRDDDLAAEEAAVRLVHEALALNHAIDLSTPLPPRAAGEIEVAFAVAEYLNAHFRDSVHLEALVAHTGYSAFHLCRLFQQRMKTSIHQYLTLLRLERAMEALADTDVPLGRLALDLGFASPSHFTTAFRRWTGHAPGQVRRRVRH